MSLRRISLLVIEISRRSSMLVILRGAMKRSDWISSPNPHCATSVCVAHASSVRTISPRIIFRISAGFEFLMAVALEPSEVADGLQGLIGRLDRLAVELKGALGLNEGDQFLHRIDVAAFKEALEDRASAVL